MFTHQLDCDKIRIEINGNLHDLYNHGLEYIMNEDENIFRGDFVIFGELNRKNVFTFRAHTEFLAQPVLYQTDVNLECINMKVNAE